MQLPAWNEALGLPRPWDQQWALRMQQVLAYETDLLEYEDLFAGSTVVEAKVESLMAEARAEIDRVAEMGGAVAAVESGYMKGQLVSSLSERRRRMESGEHVVVGVNRFDDDRAEPAAGRGGRRGRAGGPGHRGGRGRGDPGLAGRPRRGRGGGRAAASCGTRPRPTRT